jgi:hypothetical protein
MEVAFMASIAVGFIIRLVGETVYPSCDSGSSWFIKYWLMDLNSSKYHYSLPTTLQPFHYRIIDRTCHQAIKMKLSTTMTPWCREINEY